MSNHKNTPTDYSNTAINLADTSTNGNNTNDRVEWSRATILDFIEDYRQQRVLWDPNTKGYHIKQTKYESLKGLGQKYGTEIRSIRSKIKSLRSSFHREHGKVITGRHKGVHYQPMWFAYEAIRFILDGETSTNPTTNNNSLTKAEALETQQQQTKVEPSYGSESEEPEEKFLTGMTSFEDDETVRAAHNKYKREHKEEDDDDHDEEAGKEEVITEDMRRQQQQLLECGQDLSIMATDLSGDDEHRRRHHHNRRQLQQPQQTLKQIRRQRQQQRQLLQDSQQNSTTTRNSLSNASAETKAALRSSSSMLQAVGEESNSAVGSADSIVARLAAAAAFAAVASASGRGDGVVGEGVVDMVNSLAAVREGVVDMANSLAVIRSDDFDADLQNYCKLISADDVKTEIIEQDIPSTHHELAMVEIPRTSSPYPINNRKRKFLNQREDTPLASKKLLQQQIHSNMQHHQNAANPNVANTKNSNKSNNANHLSVANSLATMNGGGAGPSSTSASSHAAAINAGSSSSNAVSNSSSDEYGVFGEYVAITIRKLKTSKAKIVVKHLINNLLYEAEMGKYDHGIPSCKEPPQLYKM